MDVTGKPEDEVATALFDAGWDESRAIGKLINYRTRAINTRGHYSKTAF